MQAVTVLQQLSIDQRCNSMGGTTYKNTPTALPHGWCGNGLNLQNAHLQEKGGKFMRITRTV